MTHVRLAEEHQAPPARRTEAGLPTEAVHTWGQLRQVLKIMIILINKNNNHNIYIYIITILLKE